MNAEVLNQRLCLKAKHAYFFKDGTWYHQLKRFPSILIDNNGYISFATEESYRNTPGLQFGPAPNQVHIRPEGIKSLPGYILFSPEQLDIILEIKGEVYFRRTGIPTSEKTLMIKREIETRLRNQQLVKQLKAIYENCCQLCGVAINKRLTGFYSEVHHIIPLGRPHNGPDDLGNMICVCPNHHAQLGFFAIELAASKLTLRHAIAQTSIDYHNTIHRGNE